MAKTLSYMLPLGTTAPDFNLPDFDGNNYKQASFNDAPALLVAFICSHCPYVKHVQKEFTQMVKEYQQKGVAVVAVNSNDIKRYPQDGPQMMAQDAKTFGYTFPFLFDETQQVAKAYKAVCTPDYFLFDKNRELVYRGRMDASRPENNLPVTGEDLRAAMDAVLENRPVSDNQVPSLGCSIKWKPGNEPDDD